MPFAAGAIVLGVLTVANLGPVALAVPRWTLLATAGVVLGGAGITGRTACGTAAPSSATSDRCDDSLIGACVAMTIGTQ